MQSPTNGQPEFQHYRPVEASQANIQTHPVVSPLPPPTAFQMYADQRHLSPQHHPGKDKTSLATLMKQAEDGWDAETEGVKQLYLLRETREREIYEKQLAAAREYESQQQKKDSTPEDEKAVSAERDMEKEGGERMEVDNADREAEATEGGADAAGGFTSING